MRIFQIIIFVFIGYIAIGSPSLKSLENIENCIYKETLNLDLKLYVFKPYDWNVLQERPSIVFYFGGGWYSRHITQFVEYAKYYSSKGYVCFIADYRVRSTEKCQAIDSLRDAQDAFAFIRINSDKFGINKNRIAAAGASAGGHLAASLGTLVDPRFQELSKPNALILFNPVCVVDPFKNPDRYNFSKLGVKGYEISPYHNIEKNTPPTIIYHGTRDKLVSYETAEMFYEKMKKMGNDCTLIPFHGRDHGFFNHEKHLPDSDYKKTLNFTDEFLARIGW